MIDTPPYGKNTPQTAAFTLIELSVVLVVIALLVGGIVVGKDLMRSSTIRASITQLGEYDAAISNYRDRFGCLPGDNPRQPWYSLTGSVRCDGKIRDRNSSDTENSGDICNVWSQLSISGLIKETYTCNSTTHLNPWIMNRPEFKLKPNLSIVVASASGSNIAGHAAPWVHPRDTTVFFIASSGAKTNVASTSVYTSTGVNIHPRLAFDFDTKIDDGRAINGKVRATNGWSIVGQPNGSNGFGGPGCVLTSNKDAYWVLSTAAEDAAQACGLSIATTWQ